MNDVIAIVVTYNRKDLLKECISHLKAQTQKLDILIVDNCSTDGTSESFSNCTDDLIYCNTGSNLGGAGGFSFGIKKAVELGYKYLWILDDDTMPTESALEMFLNADKRLNGNYGFLSSKVLWKDNSICTMNKQKITKWKQVEDYSKFQKIQYASFVSLFVKSETVMKTGLPYKDFFIWADDWEYTRRISKMTDSYLVPDSVVNHWCNSNVGADIVSVSEDRIDRFKYMYRNDVVMYKQDGIEGMLYLFIRNLLHIFRILIKSDNKMAKIKLLFKSTFSGFSFKSEIEFPKVN